MKLNSDFILQIKVHAVCKREISISSFFLRTKHSLNIQFLIISLQCLSKAKHVLADERLLSFLTFHTHVWEKKKTAFFCRSTFLERRWSQTAIEKCCERDTVVNINAALADDCRVKRRRKLGCRPFNSSWESHGMSRKGAMERGAFPVNGDI